MGEDNTSGEVTPQKHLPEALRKNIWKKGQSGNPNGRPKGTLSVVEAIRSKLKECPEGQNKTYLELLIARYFKKAIQDGDTRLITDIIDRVDGKPTQKIETRFTDLDGEIDRLEADYDEYTREVENQTKEQVVADEPSVQDQG